MAAGACWWVWLLAVIVHLSGLDTAEPFDCLVLHRSRRSRAAKQVKKRRRIQHQGSDDDDDDSDDALATISQQPSKGRRKAATTFADDSDEEDEEDGGLQARATKKAASDEEDSDSAEPTKDKEEAAAVEETPEQAARKAALAEKRRKRKAELDKAFTPFVEDDTLINDDAASAPSSGDEDLTTPFAQPQKRQRKDLTASTDEVGEELGVGVAVGEGGEGLTLRVVLY